MGKVNKMRKKKWLGFHLHYLPGKCRGLGYNIVVMRRTQEASKEGENMDVWHWKEL
jgi:hypothetical protein